MFTATIGQACSSCSSTSRPLASVCLVNEMFTDARLNAHSPDDGEGNGGRPVVARDGNLGGEALGRGNEGARCRRGRLADDERHSAICAFTNPLGGPSSRR